MELIETKDKLLKAEIEFQSRIQEIGDKLQDAQEENKELEQRLSKAQKELADFQKVKK